MAVSLTSALSISRILSASFLFEELSTLVVQGSNILDSDLFDGFEKAWNYSTVGAVLVGGATAIALSLWVASRIAQPLTQMEAIANQFAAGELEERVPYSAIPELNALSSSFNRMATRLEGVEKQRRSLIGDLTHELRTPLTIVRCYLEEFADGRMRPDPEKYYLLIAEMERLERLIDDLQDLSKAEAGHLPLNLLPLRFLLY